jgi:uncharacterized membrane protein YeiH
METLVLIGDYFGTFVFALTGGLAAAEKRLDLGGFALLAFLTGVGGGTLRDLILARGVVFWAEEPTYVVLCLLGAVVAFVGGRRLPALRSTLVWADALGLALFAVIGTGIALQHDARTLPAILMGILTAAGGGVLREVVRNELPLILHRDLYMSAALAGSVSMIALVRLDAPPWAIVGGGFAVGFGTRAAGILFDLHLPVFRDRAPSKRAKPIASR